MAGNTRTITVRVPVELFERVEAARGAVAREKWIRSVIEEHLAGPIPGPNMQSVRSSARVKRDIGPVQSVRSSEQAKRGVGPVPKR